MQQHFNSFQCKSRIKPFGGRLICEKSSPKGYPAHSSAGEIKDLRAISGAHYATIPRYYGSGDNQVSTGEPLGDPSATSSEGTERYNSSSADKNPSLRAAFRMLVSISRQNNGNSTNYARHLKYFRRI